MCRSLRIFTVRIFITGTYERSLSGHISRLPPPSSLLIAASHFQAMLTVTLQLGFNCNAENYKLCTVN